MCEIKVQIPLRTVEEWEAGRRKPPEYIPRLKKYQIMYEQQFGKQNKKEHDDTVWGHSLWPQKKGEVEEDIYVSSYNVNHKI